MYTCSFDKQEFPTRHDLNEHRRQVHFLRIKGRYRNKPDPKLIEMYGPKGTDQVCHNTVDAVFFVQEDNNGDGSHQVCVSIKGSIFILDETFDTEDAAVAAMKFVRGE